MTYNLETVLAAYEAAEKVAGGMSAGERTLRAMTIGGKGVGVPGKAKTLHQGLQDLARPVHVPHEDLSAAARNPVTARPALRASRPAGVE